MINHKVATTGRARAQQTRAATTNSKARTSQNRSRRGQATVNRDSLLQSLFPNGIPARQEVIQRVNRWLEEAEQIARLR